MVKMKYIILADSKNTQPFEIPRQLTIINGEPLVKRTIRLLKNNGIKDILVTSHDKRFDGLGAERYEPKYNVYDPQTLSGYWLNGFPIELLDEPVTFLFGDVYFSENAIKTIVETETQSTLFFCTYQNKSNKYIKQHDEPLAYKVVDYELFKKKIDEVKKLKDQGVCCREPVVWELYRVINGQYVNEHVMTKNYVAINDESCDVDAIKDIKKLKIKLGELEMIKVEVIKEFTFAKYNEIENLISKDRKEDKRLFVGDVFECDNETCDYLMGKNPLNMQVVRIIEVIPAIAGERATEVEKVIPLESNSSLQKSIEKLAKKSSKKKNGKK